jgi:hypothetical protein
MSTACCVFLFAAAVAAEHAELQQTGRQVFSKAVQGGSMFDRWGCSTAQDKLLVAAGRLQQLAGLAVYPTFCRLST